MWFIPEILSAVFAALTSIPDKIEIKGVNLNFATAISPIVVVCNSFRLDNGCITALRYKALQMGEGAKFVTIDIMMGRNT